MKKNVFSLRKEITLVLLIKLVLIFILWGVCFQHPIDKELSSQDITQHLIGT